jgi:putative membrane protein
MHRKLDANHHALWKGFVSGLAAGLAGTTVMTLFQTGWSKAQKELSEKKRSKEPNGSEQSSQDEPSTVKVANKISEATLHRDLRKSEKEPASYAVHFAFGTLMGGIYGISSEYLKSARAGYGLLHGLGLWAGADATVLPAIGLSQPVTERSAGELTYEILAHAVYGVSSEATRRFVRAQLA